MRDAVIFDVDGTLAIKGDRSPYDWSKVGIDLPNHPVILMNQKLYSEDLDIIIVSGRDSACRDQTIEWFVKNHIEYDQLLMREAGNNEKDTVIKKRIYDEHVKDKYNVLCVFDDRPCVVRLWRSMGLFCFDCGNGIEF